MFKCLENDDIGWAKQIKKTLNEYGIEESLSQIKDLSTTKWKKKINEVIELKHKERLMEMCYGRNGEKTKTTALLTKLKQETFKRAPCQKTIRMSRFLARVRIMSFFRMLFCLKNFKMGKNSDHCNLCNVVDDENHRINYCAKFKDRNLFDSPLKIDFDSIYSDDDEAVDMIIEVVNEMWDLKNGMNQMRT